MNKETCNLTGREHFDLQKKKHLEFLHIELGKEISCTLINQLIFHCDLYLMIHKGKNLCFTEFSTKIH